MPIHANVQDLWTTLKSREEDQIHIYQPPKKNLNSKKAYITPYIELLDKTLWLSFKY